MDLLGNYSEESDDEQPKNDSKHEVKVKVDESTPTPTNNTPSILNKKKKKRKKLDISFLPENIQAALARGDTADDSDSDDHEEIRVVSVGSHEKSSSANELLSKLPKPKSSSGSTEFSKRPTPSLPKTELPIPPPALPEVKTTVSLSHDASDESGSDVDDVAIISSTKHSFSTSFQASVPAPTSSPSSNILAPPPFVLPSFDYSPAPVNTVQYTSTYLPYASPSLPSSNTISSAPSTSSSALSQQQQKKSSSKANNFRKRDREIESSLLRGDTSFLDSTDPSSSHLLSSSTNEPQFIDVHSNHEWNAEYYYDQQKRQQELQSIFNFKQNGGDKMLAQPTKLQNKRHQINSLVMSAAESEFEMLEAKGRQMKTKYETQSKYGW
jgi:hypothetical protein